MELGEIMDAFFDETGMDLRLEVLATWMKMEWNKESS